MPTSSFRLSVLTAAALTLTAAPVSADDFYAGKTVRIVVGNATGGSYDAYARIMARNMGKHMPGTPTIIVVNMPGADGIISANHLFSVADKDGTVIGTFNRYIALMKLLGNEQAKFAPEQFNWLGTTASYSENSYLFVIRAALPHRTIADLRNPSMPLHVGNVGTDVPAILKEALRLQFKLVAGYKGSDDLELAFTRGEVDAHTTGWTSIQFRHEDWLKAKFIRPMIQFGRITRLPALAEVPTARELAETPEDKALIEFAELPLLMARPFAAPPGVPSDRLAILRTAFDRTVADPDYIAEGTKQKLELTPKSGAEVTKLLDAISTVPASVVERYKKALDGKAPSGG